MNSARIASKFAALVAALCLVPLMLCVLAPPAFAQQLFFPSALQNDKVFGVGGVAWGTTNNWTIIPGQGGKTPIINTIDAGTDGSTAGRTVIMTNGYQCQAAQAVLGGTNIHTATGTGQGGTNGFAAMDLLLLDGYSGTTRVLQLLQVHSVGTTNISTRQSITNLDAGAYFWRCGTNQILVGITNGTTSLRAGAFIATGNKGQPTVVQQQGAGVLINTVGGRYE